MEQRRLRLGDILDDYCPRERRVTNHAVVAMIEEDVKQTRCTTCDAEHVYKGGKEPRRRKKDAGSALYEEVLAGIPEAAEAPAPVARPVAPVETPVAVLPEGEGDEAPEESTAAAPPESEPAQESSTDDGPFHRRLIRATLPRPEGQKETRQVPDFTIRQNTGRGHGFRAGSRMRGPLGGRGPSGTGGGQGRGPGGPGRPRRFGGGNAPGGDQSGRGGRPGFGNRGRKR
jgi:hypothetical protein